MNDSASPTLTNVVAAAGFGDDFGGGVYNAGASAPVLNNVTASGNAGLIVYGTSVVIAFNSRFTGSPDSVYVQQTASSTLIVSTITGGTTVDTQQAPRPRSARGVVRLDTPRVQLASNCT